MALQITKNSHDGTIISDLIVTSATVIDFDLDQNSDIVLAAYDDNNHGKLFLCLDQEMVQIGQKRFHMKLHLLKKHLLVLTMIRILFLDMLASW